MSSTTNINTVNTNTGLMIFESEEFGRIRTVLRDGEPWFAGRDVAAALGYANPANAVTIHVDAEDKTIYLNQVSGSNYKSRIVMINESGLYSLILSGKLDAAKKFKRWVTSEVLPCIRKHGAYMTDTLLEQLAQNPDAVIEYLNRLREENAHSKSLARQLKNATKALAAAKPKEDYYDAYVKNDDMLCFRYVAKELGIPERQLIGYLIDKKFLYRDIHRENRVFPRAGRKNSRLFGVREFHAKKSGYCGQYTLMTVEGRKYLVKHMAKIAAYTPKEQKPIAPEICPAEIASAGIK